MEDDACSNTTTVLENEEATQTNNDKDNNNAATELDHQIEHTGETDITPQNNNMISTEPEELLEPTET